jgi:hypothetical protein
MGDWKGWFITYSAKGAPRTLAELLRLLELHPARRRSVRFVPGATQMLRRATACLYLSAPHLRLIGRPKHAQLVGMAFERRDSDWR